MKRQMFLIKTLLGVTALLFLVFGGIQLARGSDTDSAIASVSVYDPRGPIGSVIAVPEKRVPDVLPERVLNRATMGRLNIYPQGAMRDPAHLYSTQMVTTTDDGSSDIILFESMATGTYDFTFKGYSHLTRLIADNEVGYFVDLDFTDGDTHPLLSGDINSTEGDDEVNSLDISLLVNAWNTDNARADLNQDTEVNSIDISNLLANFNEQGD